MSKIEFDYQRAGALLNIVQQVAGVSPQFTAISGEAMSELREMNDTLARLARERGEALKAEAELRAANEAQEAREAGAEVDTPNPALDPHPVPSEPIDHTKTAESSEANRRSNLAKQSLDTHAGIRRPQ